MPTPKPSLQEIEKSLEKALHRIDEMYEELHQLRHFVGKSYGAVQHILSPKELCDDCGGEKHE